MEITFFNEQEDAALTEELTSGIKHTLDLLEGHAGIHMYVNIKFTTEAGIRSLNKEFRGIDSVTDVLSFPAYDLQGHTIAEYQQDIDAEYIDHALFMGDIAICMRRAQQQAEEYDHSLMREVAFLSVHGMLHLMGFDHQTVEDEKTMLAEAEYILSEAGIERETDGK
ncbi:MAG: rRNA maturation RNase YbeY [Christensenellaceae bacterium]|jgi:probable rRNA maturation factor